MKKEDDIAETQAIEEVLGIWGPQKLPYDPDYYEKEPDGFQSDSEKRDESMK